MDFAKFKIERPREGYIEVSATIPAAEIDSLIQDALVSLAASVGIDADGSDLVALRTELLGGDLYTEEEIQTALTEYVLGCCVGEVVDASHEEIIGQPRLGYEQGPVAGNDLAVKVAALVKPQLTLSSYEPVEIEVPDTEIRESDVLEQIDAMAERWANYTPSELRHPLEEGDYAFITTEVSRDGEKIDELSSDKANLHVSYDSMPEEFIDHVIGAEIGKEVEFDFMGPEIGAQTHDPTVAYHAKVRVICLLDRNVPEITDEWLKETNAPYENMGALKRAIRNDLELQVLQQMEQYKEYAVDEAIIERLQGSIPDAIYEFVIEEMEYALQEELDAQGISRAEFYRQQGTNEQEYNAGTMMEVQHLLRRNLALEALFRGRRMKVNERDVDETFSEMFPDADEELRDMLEATGEIRQVREEAVRRKARRWLVDNAICKVVDAPTS